MFRPVNTIILLAVLTLSLSGLSALGEIRTGCLETALPATSITFIYSRALRTDGIRLMPVGSSSRVYHDVFGGKACLGLSPKFGVGAWIYGRNQNTNLELQAKYLAWNKGNSYVAFAPSVLSATGKYEQSVNEKCEFIVTGLSLPLIWTKDSERNLLFNFSAALNLDWATYRGRYRTYDSGVHSYITTSFQREKLPIVHSEVGLSLAAKAGALILLPEVGLIYLMSGDQGQQRLINYGVSLGGSF